MVVPPLTVLDSGCAGNHPAQSASLQIALRCPQFFMNANGTVYGCRELSLVEVS